MENFKTNLENVGNCGMWSYEFSSDIMDADNDVDICSGEDK